MAQATKKIVDQLNQGLTSGLEFGRTKWRLLEKSGGKVLLLSENLVDQAPYDRSSGREFVSWERSHLRRHMSRDLPIILFSDAEYNCIASTRTTDTSNPVYRSRDYGVTDKLFPLSIEEVDRYLGDGNLLRKAGSDYLLSDAYDRNRIASFSGTNIWWWLRTPGEKIDNRGNPWSIVQLDYRQAYVGNVGRINASGSSYSDSTGGIRPAMWLNL